MNIKKKIKERGYTIAEVASQMKNEREGKIGMSQGALSGMLGGNPTINRLQEIANIIGVPLPELVADSEDNLQGFIICPHCGKRIKLSVGK